MPSRACQSIREELKFCLLLSDCHRKEKKTLFECLQPDNRKYISDECHGYQLAFSTCEIDLEEESTWKLKNRPSIFVTVGTTSFDELVGVFNKHDFQNIVLSLGYRRVVFQIGRGTIIPESCSDLIYEYFTFKSNLQEEFDNANLIVSHAGAGTCLEVCKASIRLVVVVNDKLMHNHQTELALKLQERGHCIFSTCCELPSFFQSNTSTLASHVNFDDVFSKFETDYYHNVAKAIAGMF